MLNRNIALHCFNRVLERNVISDSLNTLFLSCFTRFTLVSSKHVNPYGP